MYFDGGANDLFCECPLNKTSHIRRSLSSKVHMFVLPPCSPCLGGENRFQVCNTPTLNFGTSGFNEAASSAVISASRVSRGSMILSIHSRAAPYRGSICSS